MDRTLPKLGLLIQSINAQTPPHPHTIKVYDVRCFSDPDSVAHFRYHDGRHPGIVSAFANNELFMNLCMDVIHIITELRRNRTTGSVLTFRCRGGKHRSVAASLFALYFARQNGFAPTWHYEEHVRWCTCPDCSNGAKDKEGHIQVYGSLALLHYDDSRGDRATAGA